MACFPRSVKRSTIRSFVGKNLIFPLIAELLHKCNQIRCSKMQHACPLVCWLYQVPESASASSIPKHLCSELMPCHMSHHGAIQSLCCSMHSVGVGTPWAGKNDWRKRMQNRKEQCFPAPDLHTISRTSCASHARIPTTTETRGARQAPGWTSKRFCRPSTCTGARPQGPHPSLVWQVKICIKQVERRRTKLERVCQTL